MEHYTAETHGDIVTVRILRKLNLEDILKVIEKVARTSQGNNRLWNVTEAFDFSMKEVGEIAKLGRTCWPFPSRVAYVAADDLSFGLLRMFEVFREEEDYLTRVFRNENDASEWLKSGKPFTGEC